MICLIAEAVAEVRGHGLSPRIPLGGGSQTLARRLVAGVVLIAGAASVTLPVANAVTTSGASPTSVSVSQGGDDSASTYRQTEKRSTVLSGGHTGVRTNNDQTGQVVKYTEVRPPEGRNYDCLWDIAERYLGEGRRVQGDLRPQQEQAAARRPPA